MPPAGSLQPRETSNISDYVVVLETGVAALNGYPFRRPLFGVLSAQMDCCHLMSFLSYSNVNLRRI